MPAPAPVEPYLQEGYHTGPLHPDHAPIPPLYAPPAPKKGRLWPPIVCLCILFLTGLIVHILLPLPTDDDPPEWADPLDPGAFFENEIEKNSHSCFSVRGGALYFDPDLYTGGKSLIVPSLVDGIPVTSISSGCFLNCTELTAIELPDTVKTIQDGAFAGCTSLRGIQIPEGVTTIGSYAFSGCGALEAISLPSSLEEVGEDIFHDCAYLHYIYYNGTMNNWRSLCPDVVNPFTDVTCIDGRSYQGIFLP